MSTGPRNKGGTREGQDTHRRQIWDGKEDRFSNRKSCPGTEEAIWPVSEFHILGGIQEETGNPSTHPTLGLPREFLHWDESGEAALAK